MEVDFIETLAKLRLTVGFLGEKEQFGWWQSSFFTQGSNAFLAPLFARTQVLAQCNGVTKAATLIHDERIGIGNVYHLFRLTEDIEQNIHKGLHDIKLQDVFDSKSSALDYLRKNSTQPNTSNLGPTKVGDKASLNDLDSWKIVAGLYLSAFKNGKEIYPYFSEIL